ncbi:MAG: efflux RND transporter periplasmic adaptor subunit [Phycisphaerae bacterium]
MIPRDLPRPRTSTVIVVTLLFVAFLGGLFALGWWPHHEDAQQVRADIAARNADAPLVIVAQPRTAGSGKDLILPCDVRPNQDTAIYPRANGYLKKLNVDMQDHVKAGDVLAEIEALEIDEQLNQSKAALDQARAGVDKAQSDLDLAERTLTRYKLTEQTGQGTITKQEMDERQAARDQAAAALNLSKANVVAAAADVQRLTVLKSFEKVIAPFSGIITARNYDVGALLSPTNTGPGKELFHLTQSDTLRVFVNVPQIYADDLKIGQPAALTVRNFPGRKFQGNVTRRSGALDANARTMPFELDFPNADGALFPGMYGQVQLTITDERPVLLIPTSALIFNAAGLQVAVVQNDKVHLQKVSVGRDLGTDMEIIDGLSNADQVITNPGERLHEGVSVRMQRGEAAAK